MDDPRNERLLSNRQKDAVCTLSRDMRLRDGVSVPFRSLKRNGMPPGAQIRKQVYRKAFDHCQEELRAYAECMKVLARARPSRPALCDLAAERRVPSLEGAFSLFRLVLSRAEQSNERLFASIVRAMRILAQTQPRLTAPGDPDPSTSDKEITAAMREATANLSGKA